MAGMKINTKEAFLELCVRDLAYFFCLSLPSSDDKGEREVIEIWH